MRLSTGDLPRIVGVHVREYKNLRDVWLPWSEGLALFGANGAGKTNLLECLALLLGSVETVSLARPRLQRPVPGALSILVRIGVDGLPGPPDKTLRFVGGDSSDSVGAEDAKAVDGLHSLIIRAAADGRWWRDLGVGGGADFREGIDRADLPSSVAVYLAGIADDAVVGFRLESIDLDVHQATTKVTRRFRRMLMVRDSDMPRAIRAVAHELPEAFAPLRRFLDQPRDSVGGWFGLLDLPAVDEAPAVLQWLARPRTDVEIDTALAEAFQGAAEPAAEFLTVMRGRMPFGKPPEGKDWHWWLHDLASAHGMAELRMTVPGVAIEPRGDGDADFAIEVNGGAEVGRTGTDVVLARLSAGQRRWADEAAASMARMLDAFGQRASLYVRVAQNLDDDEILEVTLPATEAVEAEVAEYEFWTGRAVDLVLQTLEPRLRASVLDRVGPGVDFIAREIEVATKPELRTVLPRLVVRVFDEPEAHLHPAAQRRVSAALRSMSHQGSNVVIASHSAHFLDLEGWTQVHVYTVDGHGSVLALDAEVTRARDRLAHELGINRGELLAGIGSVLIVEGEHDRLVLETLYGNELRAAGVAIIRMHGTAHLFATADLDFVDRYLDVPVVVLVDNATIERVEDGTLPIDRLTDEEQALRRLARRCRQRGRRYTLVGLDRPDITAYLNEEAIRELHPYFARWHNVLRTFRQRTSRPKFKEWVRDNYDTDLTTARAIRDVLHLMSSRNLPPTGDLHHKVNEILAAAGSGPSDA